MYRAAPPSSLLIEALDELTVAYHRRSGATHLLASPAPELLQALREPAEVEELLARLADAFVLVDGGREALSARLDELVAAGLVERI